MLIDLLHDAGHNFVVTSGIKGSKFWKNRLFTDPVAAMDWINREHANGRNVFVKHGEHDGVMKDAKAPDCKAQHFTGSRSFFVDADYGHGKTVYKTPRELIDAWRIAVAKINGSLPHPNVVQATGSGLHIVWTLDEIIPAAEWRTITQRLFALLRNNGFVVDSGANHIDLNVRVCGPGFFNFNHGKPIATATRVYNTNRISASLFRSAIASFGLRAVPSGVLPAQSVPLQRRATGHDPFTMEVLAVAQGCEVIKAALETGGQHHNNEEWYAVVSVLSKAKDEDEGRRLAHAVSNQYPTYSEEETDFKYDSARSGTHACPSCATLANLFPAHCAKCAYNGKIKSPASIHSRPEPVALPDQTVPRPPGSVDPNELPVQGFANGAQGIIHLAKNDDGEYEWQLLWPHAYIINVELHKMDGENRYILSFDYGVQDIVHVVLHANDMADQRATAAQLSSQFGITLASGLSSKVHSMFSSWIEQLKERVGNKIYYSSQGWSNDGSKFVHGNTVFHEDGTETKTITNNDNRQFVPKGDSTYQHQLLSDLLVSEDRDEAHMMLAASLAAPMLRFVGTSGMCLNFYSSGSAYGKTTLSRAAASFWGSQQAMMMGVDDTAASTIKRIGTLHNLPAFYDEIRGKYLDEAVSQFIFRMPHGREKSRMSSSTKLHEQLTWRTLLIFSTNIQFSTILKGIDQAGDAAAARFIDIEMPPLNQATMGSPVDIEQLVLEFNNHYGWVGHWIGRHLAEHHVAVRQRIVQIASKLMGMTAARANDTSGRNHANVGAILCVAADIAARENFVPLDPGKVVRGVKKHLVHLAKEARQEAVVRSNPASLLSEYLSEHARDRVIVIDHGTYRTTDPSCPTPNRSAVYEIDKTNKCVIVNVLHFQRWAVNKGFNARDLKTMNWPVVQASIGGGTSHALAERECYRIPALGPLAPLV